MLYTVLSDVVSTIVHMGLYQLQLYGSCIKLTDYTKIFRPRLADMFILDTLCMSLVRLDS
jgi:hypothetical protein